MAAERPYRVDWTPAFDTELSFAHPLFLELFYESVIPLLQYEPTRTTGPFQIAYDPPYFSMEVRAENGEFGWVVYQVIEDLRYVMIITHLFPADPAQ